ncbi:uncharacterized protein LOC142981802 [Anticarsia gemmatalis]|uniref:uncharacterized protein LOC142981802 n=1 Tax=Anticarsia gemmatalis TaxID=129554 RepID=UPI003F75B58B
MDCYKSESDFIDSLDFLSPPVKRVQSSRDDIASCNYSRCSEEDHNGHLFRRAYFRSYEEYLKGPRVVRAGVTSSTSLVLKKTSERQILKSNSVVSYTAFRTPKEIAEKPSKLQRKSKSKPLIKVTVIPKKDQVQTARLLRKRRRSPKNIQSSTSNQDNSVQTKNVYLIVAGRRRDKIYEIKTTGSATVSNESDNYEDFPIERLTSIKHFMRSLNMEKHGNTNGNDYKFDVSQNCRVDAPQQTTFMKKPDDGCKCEDEYVFSSVVEGAKELHKKNRVKIYGQLGVTDGDRYLLRYGATVNDKPVTEFARITQDLSTVVAPLSEIKPKHRFPTTQDSAIQTDLPGNPTRRRTTTSRYRKESQGTQVNFNVQVTSARDYDGFETMDKNIQCDCNLGNNVMENIGGDNCLKNCQSPLVIISVYPKASPETVTSSARSLEHDRSPSPTRIFTAKDNRQASSKIDKSTDERIDGPRRRSTVEREDNIHSLFRSRSPSPNKKSPRDDKEPDAKHFKVRAAKRNTESHKAIRAIQNKILQKDKIEQNRAGTSKFIAPSFQNRSPKGQGNFRKSSPPRLEERATNTEHANTKQNLIDNFTKKVPKRSKYKYVPAKQDNSKITIDIEGERERYNVLLDQALLTTDVRIKKTMKDIGSQHGGHKMASESLENLLLLPEKETDLHPIKMYANQMDEIPMNERISGITIRDSLELFHRREERHNTINTQTGINNTYYDNNGNNTTYSVPFKHYTGDDCSICNPVERDRQIRELLGVDKSKPIATKPLQAYSFENGGRPYHCIYRRECEKTRLAGLSFIHCFRQKTEKCLEKEPIRCVCTDSFLDTASPCKKVVEAKRPECCPPAKTPEPPPREESKHCCVKKDSNEDSYTLPGNAENSAVYQQLILNRNIQVFLQIEQFSKQRPIILSRKQYDKVKRIIQSNISHKCCREKRKKISDRTEGSQAMFGEIKRRTTIEVVNHVDESVQTDKAPCNRSNCRRARAKKCPSPKGSLNPRVSAFIRTSTSPRPSGRYIARLSRKSGKYKREKSRRITRHDDEDSNSDNERPEGNVCHRNTCADFQPFKKHIKSGGLLNSREESCPKCERQKSNESKKSSGTIRHISVEQRKRICGELRKSHMNTEDGPLSPGSDQKPRVEERSTDMIIGDDGYDMHNMSYEPPVRCRGTFVNHIEVRSGILHCKSPGENRLLNRIGCEYCRPNVKRHREYESFYKHSRQYYRDNLDFNPGAEYTKTCLEHQRIDIEDQTASDILRHISRREQRLVGDHRQNIPNCMTCQEYLAITDQSMRPYELTGLEYDETLREQSEFSRRSDDQVIAIEYNENQHNLNEERRNYHTQESGDHDKPDKENKTTVMLYVANDQRDNVETENQNPLIGKTMSSLETHKTSMVLLNHVSSSNVAVMSDSSLGHAKSFHTIFRGHKKTPTPNLGTSVYSLYSEDGFNSVKSVKFITPPQIVKPAKRPFLRRLMSCLVMRSTRASVLKLPTIPAPELNSLNSSVDSYHISTSLGGVELTSSIYDTSASFYSNHTILPLNSKMKRGFFSSVRGFLINRRS